MLRETGKFFDKERKINFNDKILFSFQLEIKFETSNAEMKYSKDGIWNEDIIMNVDDGTLHMRAQFFPEEIHGQWKIECDSNAIILESTRGKIDGKNWQLFLKILPSTVNDTIKIFFDFMICGGETCIYKKKMLKVNIRRKENSIRAATCVLKKNLL